MYSAASVVRMRFQSSSCLVIDGRKVRSLIVLAARPVRIGIAPISSITSAPSAASDVAAPANRTVAPICCVQYSAFASSFGAALRPVTVETIGSCALRQITVDAMAAKSSIIGRMSGEWKACETRSGCETMPRARSDSQMRVTSVAGPEMTTSPGALIAATATAVPLSSGSTSPAAAAIAAMAPPSGSACIRRPRADTSRMASPTESTPAITAAAYSPMLWPQTRSASTPHDAHNFASAYSTAKMAGWVKRVCRSSASLALAP